MFCVGMSVKNVEYLSVYCIHACVCVYVCVDSTFMSWFLPIPFLCCSFSFFFLPFFSDLFLLLMFTYFFFHYFSLSFFLSFSFILLFV